MPIDSNTRLYYRLEGLPSKPVLVLSHSLGADHGMWLPQVPTLLEHFRILRYDTRGHGASDAPPGEYPLERLGRDVLALADSLGIDKFAFCGLSLGGMTGQWIAAHAPERVTHLVLANTSPKFPDPAIMQNRIQTVLSQGMAPLEASVMGRFFLEETLAARNRHAETSRAVLLATNPVGYAGCCAAVRDLDNRDILSRIVAPTLVIGGTRDLSTPWEGHGSVLASEIRGAKWVLFETAHLSNIERPGEFTGAVLEFMGRGNKGQIYDDFELEIVSSPDREGVYVEGWVGPGQMFDVRQDSEGRLLVDVFPAPRGTDWTLLHADLVRLLNESREKLLGEGETL
jgi:3-oxoadipate enol-lactonase